MAKKLAFTLELEGSEKLISNLTSVELELSSIGKRLRQVKKDLDVFNNGTKEQREELLKSGKSVESLTQEYKGLRDEQLRLQAEGARLRTDLRQQAKDFDRVKQNIPDDSLIGLRRRYEQLRKEINQLSGEARQLPENLKKIREAESVKKQIDDIGASVRDFRTNVGNYKEAIADVLSTFSKGGSGGISAIVNPLSGLLGGGGNPLQAITGVTKALGPYGAAIGAVISASGALVGYISDITLEFEKLNNVTGSTTGLVGENLAQATVGVKALAETFDQDFNEVLQAANTLTKEVTGDFNKSIELIKTGFLAGANANGEFLDSIREYSTQIREAGASGEEFIEILTRAQREGIYSDKGVDLVKEFGNKIRQQTDSTKKALEDAFGEDFTSNLFDGINDGSVTTVTALTKVAKELNDTELTAKQTQQVVADVFGGPGEDAGLRFIKILKDVDGNLDNLVDNTDAYTQRQNALFDANRDLITQQNILANTFAGTGTEIEVLTTKAKALATEGLNSLIRGFRITYRSVEELGFRGLFEKTVTAEDIIREDQEAVRQQLEETELEFQKQVATLAEVGGSYNELVQAQSKLNSQLREGKLNGELYQLKIDQLSKIKQKLSEKTKELNGNIETTKRNFQQLAADGSIEQLSKKVSELQKQVNEASPNKALELIEELNQAELVLSQAKTELEEFKESLKETNVANLPIEEQVEYYKEQIEQRRQLDIQYAQERIDNERVLSEELSKINLEKDIESLNEELKLFKDGSSEYLKVINDINSKKDEIKDIEIRIDLINSEETLEEARLINERLLTEAFEDEEQLQARLKLLRTQTDVASINKRIELEREGSIERLRLESELTDKIKQLREEQARVGIDFDARQDGIESDTQNQLAGLIPEFDTNDIQGTLQRLKEFEEQKSIIQIEEKIRLAELDKELLLAQGLETVQVQNEIDTLLLDLNKKKNEDKLKQEEETLEKQRKLVEDLAAAEKKALEATGEAIGSFLVDSLSDSEKAFKGLAKSLFSTVVDLLAQQATLLVAQAFGQPDSVASFGASGAARVAIITGLIKGASSAIKNLFVSQLSESGNVLGLTQGKQTTADFKNGSVFRGPNHKNGGIKFLLKSLGGAYTLNEAEGGEPILTKRSFKKWPGLISAINEDGGGKKLSSNSNYWKKLLKSLEVKKYAAGDVLGTGPVSSNNIPQLVNPTTVINAVARIPEKDIEDLVTAVVEEQVIKLIPTIDGIADKVVEGLQEDNRLKERLGSAQANAQL